MPKYLAPSVYVEEASFRAKSIEGVSTSTAGFVGPTRYGPVNCLPELVTSLADFERSYGDRSLLAFADWPGGQNYLWHAVRNFFDEGGQRLYVSRIFKANGTGDDGIGRGLLPASSGLTMGASDESLTAAYPHSILVRARFPGSAGNLGVRFTLRHGPNILMSDGGKAIVNGLTENDVVWLGDLMPPVDSPPGTAELRIAKFDNSRAEWRFVHANVETVDDLWLNESNPSRAVHPENKWEIRIVTLDVVVDQGGVRRSGTICRLIRAISGKGLRIR